MIYGATLQRTSNIIFNGHTHKGQWDKILPSTWRAFDPGTAYVVCISVSLGFPFMVSISLSFPHMVMLQTFQYKCHCFGCGVAMDCYGCCTVPGSAIVTSRCYGHYCFMEYVRTWVEFLSMPWQREFTMIMGALSVDWFCRTSMWFVAYFC